jgi:hypothetical protein
MMQLLCDDVTPWSERVNRADFLSAIRTSCAKRRELQAWGLRVMFISDPSGDALAHCGPKIVMDQ